MRFVLLVGCLSLSACAVLVTVRIRSLNRKLASFAPIHGNNVVQFSDKLGGHLQKSLNRSGESSVCFVKVPIKIRSDNCNALTASGNSPFRQGFCGITLKASHQWQASTITSILTRQHL